LKPYVQTILDSGETLLRLLTDALDFSRADAGQLDLDERPMRVAALVEDVADLWSARASAKSLTLTAVYDGPDDLWALGDTVRLKQVFNNLVGNALKFTDQGGVDVRLRAERDGIYVKLSADVSDSGPGVEESRLQGIFQPFTQEEAGRAKGGAGLGLSICRELIERMHGVIFATRAPGGGLAVSFTATLFHVEGVAAAPPSADPTPPLPGPLHVLIADDNATNRLVAETLCDIFDCTCHSVTNGAEALQMLRDGAFDLALIDIKMPVMNGLEAVRLVRALTGPASQIPILALTANANPFDAAAYVQAGFDGVVEKPIKPAAMLAAMHAAIAAGARRGVEASEAA
jgi:CheY-like chemotaxis protein